MSKPNGPSILRLVLIPAVLTTLVSLARLYAEVNGHVAATSGGFGILLGITWLVPLFGALFGYRIARSGSSPRLRPAALWFAAALLPVVAAVALGFSGLDQGDTSEAGYQALRSSVLMIVIASVVCATFALLVWWRLAFALLVYGLCARAAVVAIAYVAKVNRYDTHYTKFGPAGIERDLADTMVSAAVSQFGFWVPLTILVGGLCGSLAARLTGRK